MAVISATPDEVATTAFVRDIPPFETGELKWVRVLIPLRDLEAYGEEVRLKDPSQFYPDAPDAMEFSIGNEIGENETEKIIRQIESNRNAEPGYWYKVFKDYKNRDDELFFYHLKTGDVPQPDFGPESDFQDLPPRSQPVPESNSSGSELLSTPNDDSAPHDPVAEEKRTESEPSNLNTSEPPNDLHAAHPQTSTLQAHPATDHFSTDSLPAGLSATSLMMAGMLLERRNAAAENRNPPADDNPDSHDLTGQRRPGYTLLDRWKRRLRGQLD